MGGDWKDMFRGVETNDLELVRYHVSSGIDLNYQHPEILTSALIESIERNHLTITAFLLENGAIPNLKEVFTERIPMDVAKGNRNQEAVDLLNKYLNTNEMITVGKPKSLFERLFGSSMILA